MWKYALLLVALVLEVPGALAQDAYPKLEIFGGYIYSRTNVCCAGWSNASGWATSLSGNLNRHFGFTADLSNFYGGTYESYSAIQYMAGPRFTLRGGRTTFFAHGLAGARRLHGDLVPRFTRAALDVGAGLDIRISRHASYRLFQFDYVAARQYDWRSNYQLRTGVVFRFGGAGKE